MTPDTKHTPTPAELLAASKYRTTWPYMASDPKERGLVLDQCQQWLDAVDAAFPERVRAVNAHAELVAALRAVRSIVTEAGNSITDNAAEWGVQETRNFAQQINCEVADAIDAALARAEGGQP